MPPPPIVLEIDLKIGILLLIFVGILKLVRIIKIVCIKIVCIVEMGVLPDNMPPHVDSNKNKIKTLKTFKL